MIESNHQARIDKCGIFFGSLCFLHCAIIPALVLLIPYSSASQWTPEWLHSPLALTAALFCMGAMMLGKRCHRRWYLLVIGLAGVVMLMFSLAEGLMGAFAEYLASIGALTTATAHLLNMRATVSTKPSNVISSRFY